MALKTILNVMKKWAVVFAIVAFAISAFSVIQNVQAQSFDDYGYYGEDYYGYEDDYGYYEDDYYGYEDDYGYYEDDYYGYEDDYGYYEDDYYGYEDDYGYYEDDYYGDDYYDDVGFYDDCDYYGDCYDDNYYDDCDYYGDCYDDYYDDCEYYGDCYDDCYDCYYDDCEYYGDCYDDCYDCYEPEPCYSCEPTPQPPVDKCPNIPGNQSKVPSGKVKDNNGNCVDKVSEVSVYCVATNSSNNLKVGDTVTWTATATGGNGNYSYSWSGSENLSGSNRVISKVYNSAGTKTATVKVTSGGKTDTADCQTHVQEREQDLNVICEVNKTRVEKGEEVRYKAVATGGNGNYSYSWDGSSPLDGRTGQTQYVTYSSTGSKHATVTVRSGNQTDTADCQTVVVDHEEEDEDLDLVCEVNKTRVEKGEEVRYTATATGGNGNYSYRWDGSSPLDGETGRTVEVEYNSEGRKHATVTVRSDGEEETADCDTVVVDEDEDEDEDFDVTCSAYPNSVFVNQTVTWSANVSGASGTRHYDWSGTDNLNGSNSVVYKSYNTPGTKTATVEVTINGETESDDCTVNVQGSSGQVSVYQNPGQGTLASLSSIYLSQVPYTGPEDMKYVAYLLSILVLSIGGTYYVIKRKAKLSRKNIIDAFKQGNLVRKGIN